MKLYTNNKFGNRCARGPDWSRDIRQLSVTLAYCYSGCPVTSEGSYCESSPERMYVLIIDPRLGPDRTGPLWALCATRINDRFLLCVKCTHWSDCSRRTDYFSKLSGLACDFQLKYRSHVVARVTLDESSGEIIVPYRDNVTLRALKKLAMRFRKAHLLNCYSIRNCRDGNAIPPRRRLEPVCNARAHCIVNIELI